MAFKIIWTEEAKLDRKQILAYWNFIKGNNPYAKSLNQQFKGVAKLISIFPLIGKITEDPAIRVKGVDQYQMYYEIIGNTIYILAVWDPRRGDATL